VQGDGFGVGLAVAGTLGGSRLGKTGARSGDRLLLTQPLGTGVIFAALRRSAKGSGLALEQALPYLLQSNARASEVFQRHGTSACTDVSGFGLAGHLLEMLGEDSAGLAV